MLSELLGVEVFFRLVLKQEFIQVFVVFIFILSGLLVFPVFSADQFVVSEIHIEILLVVRDHGDVLEARFPQCLCCVNFIWGSVPLFYLENAISGHV